MINISQDVRIIQEVNCNGKCQHTEILCEGKQWIFVEDIVEGYCWGYCSICWQWRLSELGIMTIVVSFFSNRRGIYLPSCTRMRQFTPSRNTRSSSFKIVAEICRDAHLCCCTEKQSVCPSKKYLFPAWKIWGKNFIIFY